MMFGKLFYTLVAVSLIAAPNRMASAEEAERVVVLTFDPTKDNPLLLPQAFDGKPDSTLEQFKAAVTKARDGKIAVNPLSTL